MKKEKTSKMYRRRFVAAMAHGLKSIRAADWYVRPSMYRGNCVAMGADGKDYLISMKPSGSTMIEPFKGFSLSELAGLGLAPNGHF